MNAFAKIMSSILLVLYYWLEGIVLTFVPKRLRYKDVTGETVLITGGGSGIGRLLALRFAKLGARVVVLDLHLPSAQETVQMVKDLGGTAHAYQCDVSEPHKVYSTAAKVKDEVGTVTILINNAGIVTGKKFLDCPDSMIRKTFEVNSMSHFWTCKAFLPDMMDANHGHIVSIASMAGKNGVAKLTDYCASKFAAVGFEEALRMELHIDGYNGIHSTVVCPYFISTGMFDGVHPGILPILTPDYVADEIVSAVLVNQEVLYLPKIFYFLVFLKAFLPPLATREALCMLSITSSMKRFHGRKEKAVIATALVDDDGLQEEKMPQEKQPANIPSPKPLTNGINHCGPAELPTNKINGHGPPKSTGDDDDDTVTEEAVDNNDSLNDIIPTKSVTSREKEEITVNGVDHAPRVTSNGHIFSKSPVIGISQRKIIPNIETNFCNFSKLSPDLRCEKIPAINGINPPSPILSGKVKMG